MKKYRILSEGSWNAKTSKNNRETLILYMSPSTQNSKGRNLCPKASAGCLASCLYTAGRGAFSNVQAARMKRTEMFLNETKLFFDSVAEEINRKAKRVDELAVRLNGTSDTKIVDVLLSKYSIAKNVVFYDYTKIHQRAGSFVMQSGHMYTVAFSRSEENEHEAIQVLSNGGIVAVVFDKLPETWYNYPVVDGDERDDLMLDLFPGTVLGLKAKGKAKHDRTGFVVKI